MGCTPAKEQKREAAQKDYTEPTNKFPAKAEPKANPENAICVVAEPEIKKKEVITIKAGSKVMSMGNGYQEFI